MGVLRVYKVLNERWVLTKHFLELLFSNMPPFMRRHSCIGEGNGNALQYSCLENPRDGRAWWAAIYGVTQLDTTEMTWQQQQHEKTKLTELGQIGK